MYSRMYSQLDNFLRLPKTPERVCGLSRSTLNGLILPTAANGFKPPVRSVVLKSSKGAVRGIRLIDLQSLIAHLAALSPRESDDHRAETAAIESTFTT